MFLITALLAFLLHREIMLTIKEWNIIIVMIIMPLSMIFSTIFTYKLLEYIFSLIYNKE